MVDSCLPYVEMRKLLRVECTGLCGSDLGSRVWGFSAGSFTGMALLDIVAADPHFAIEGTFGAVACPPALMDRFAPCQAQCIGCITMDRINCAVGHPWTMKLRLVIFVLCTSTTLTTTWIVTLVRVSTHIVIGYGWILTLVSTSSRPSAEITHLLRSQGHALCHGFRSVSPRSAMSLSRLPWMNSARIIGWTFSPLARCLPG